MLELLTENILDPVARENFQKTGIFIKSEAILKSGFKHFELSFTQTVSGAIFSHNLGFLPRDLIQTFILGSGTVTWNYNSFTDKIISVTIGGTVTATNPTTVRFFLGRYT